MAYAANVFRRRFSPRVKLRDFASPHRTPNHASLSHTPTPLPYATLLQLLSRKLTSTVAETLTRTNAELRNLRLGLRHPAFAEWSLRRRRTATDRSWKGWLGRYNLKGYYYHPLWKVAGTMSMAVVRAQFTTRLAAILLGEATLMHRFVAEAETLPSVPYFQSLQADIQPMFLLAVVVSLLEAMALVVRALYLLLLFAPAVAMAPFADPENERWRRLWLELVHRTLEHAGAAFIKWGQWAAARPDLFPKDLCETLSRLHSKAPAHDYAQTRRTVEGAFGKKLEEIFEEFDEEPVASGSIAQVHRAVLRSPEKNAGKKKSGKTLTVAVKVRHPGVTEMIRRDFVLINLVARVCGFFSGLQYLRLEESVQQFAVFMLTQVDLAREAAHLSRFIYNFRSWSDVSFPKPLYPLVHPAVLVETYERGESVSRFVDSPVKGYINSALAHIGTNTLLKMLLEDNFIHADLHPGNILVRMERFNPRPGKGLFRAHPHIVFLDVGMTAELSKKDRATLMELFKGIALRDGRKTAECTLQFSKLQTCPDPEGFVRDVEESFAKWKLDESSEMHTGDCIQELLERVRRHKVNIDGDVCTVMVTTLVLEGWQRKLDPEYNIMGTLQKLVLRSGWETSLSYTIDSIMAP